MIQWIRARPRWITATLIAVLAVTGGIASGGAIASTQETPDYCAQLYPAGGSEYERCRFWNDPSLEAGAGAIDGSQPAVNSSYTLPQPVSFCGAETPATKKVSGKTAISATSCSRPIMCTWNTSTGKYHCVDSAGNAANPPGRVCAESPNFACAAKSTTNSSTVVITPTTPPQSRHITFPSQQPQAVSPDPLAPSTDPVAAPTATAAVPAPTSSPSPTQSTTTDTGDPTAQAVQQAQTLGLNVWLDTDLVATWQAGPAQLRAAAARLAQQANQPNVTGVKFAAELGLRGGFSSADQIRTFVTETSKALREVLPAGRKIEVDVIIPELGCGQHSQCVNTMRTNYPLLSLAEVEQYVLTGAVGAIDAVNVSSPLINPFMDIYTRSGITADRVLQQQWMALRIRGWDSRGLDLGARELGLAHPDNKPALAGPVAERVVKGRLDSPLRLGAQHVVLWTWRQDWNGTAWRLNEPGLKSNSVWDALRGRKALGRTSIVFNPREVERNVGEDLREIANIASTVYITTQ
ncbi:hypothetical protein ACQPYK_49395 (plasmid) [Streptosporangium sp. CA-135522]|uniref:hypothetical protein n=1 Tax=Streptosporangium sp. CA-135522 TaxID=3240072 RepID=UPI003D949F38